MPEPLRLLNQEQAELWLLPRESAGLYRDLPGQRTPPGFFGLGALLEDDECDHSQSHDEHDPTDDPEAAPSRLSRGISRRLALGNGHSKTWVRWGCRRARRDSLAFVQITALRPQRQIGLPADAET